MQRTSCNPWNRQTINCRYLLRRRKVLAMCVWYLKFNASQRKDVPTWLWDKRSSNNDWQTNFSLKAQRHAETQKYTKVSRFQKDHGNKRIWEKAKTWRFVSDVLRRPRASNEKNKENVLEERWKGGRFNSGGYKVRKAEQLLRPRAKIAECLARRALGDRQRDSSVAEQKTETRKHEGRLQRRNQEWH